MSMGQAAARHAPGTASALRRVSVLLRGHRLASGGPVRREQLDADGNRHAGLRPRGGARPCRARSPLGRAARTGACRSVNEAGSGARAQLPCGNPGARTPSRASRTARERRRVSSPVPCRTSRRPRGGHPHWSGPCSRVPGSGHRPARDIPCRPVCVDRQRHGLQLLVASHRQLRAFSPACSVLG